MESKWIIWSFIPGINWATWIHAGVRAKYNRYFIFGVLYALPMMMYMACDTGKKGEKSSLQEAASGLGVVSWIIGIVHTQMVKKEINLRIRYAGQAGARAATDDQLEQKIASEYGLGNPSTSPPRPVRAPTLPQKAAPQPVVGPVPIQAATAAVATRVDVNSASEQQIASLPGVGPILAKKAIQFRQSERAFQSVDDFAQVLALKPHILLQIRALVVANLVATPRAVEKRSGRVVDF